MTWWPFAIAPVGLFVWLLGSKRSNSIYADKIPISVAAVQAAAASSASSSFKTVKVMAYNDNTFRSSKQNEIAAINVIRLTCPQHDLLSAKYLVEHLPQVVAAQLSPDQAERVRNQLQAAGLTVTVS